MESWPTLMSNRVARRTHGGRFLGNYKTPTGREGVFVLPVLKLGMLPAAYPEAQRSSMTLRLSGAF